MRPVNIHDTRRRARGDTHKEIPPPSLLLSRPTGYVCNSGATTLSRCLQLRLSESSLILRSEIKLNPVISLNFPTTRGREHSCDTGSNEGHGRRRENCLSLGNKHRSVIFQGKKVYHFVTVPKTRKIALMRGMHYTSWRSPSSHIVHVNKKKSPCNFQIQSFQFLLDLFLVYEKKLYNDKWYENIDNEIKYQHLNDRDLKNTDIKKYKVYVTKG